VVEVFLVSAVRTAIGSYGGSLKDQRPGELAAVPARAAIERAGIEAGLIGHAVFGSVVQTEPRDAYVARIAAITAGVPHEVPALTLNRLCASGLQAIVSAANMIMVGDCDVALAGGVDVMSQAAYFSPSMRWGQRMGDAAMLDGLTGVLSDPFHRYHMGVTAENVAKRYGITREDQDALALESQTRAARAIAEGRFKSQIVPVELKSRKGVVQFDTDEYVRKDAKAEDFASLKPVFQREDGTVTAGNASGINDGAAAVVLASGEAVRKHGLTPLARLVSYGYAGVDPAYMGIGPVPATKTALARAGISINDIDVIEANEAFAAQACAVARELDFDPAKLNPNGSGIALGHPVGATGAIITTKAVHELHRIGGRLALAAIWERA
jgi:acetyl-CoA C-acetyltransferase